jgi:hypothetical protein
MAERRENGNGKWLTRGVHRREEYWDVRDGRCEVVLSGYYAGKFTMIFCVWFFLFLVLFPLPFLLDDLRLMRRFEVSGLGALVPGGVRKKAKERIFLFICNIASWWIDILVNVEVLN